MTKKLRSTKSKRRRVTARPQQDSTPSSLTTVTANKQDLSKNNTDNNQSQNTHYQYLTGELRQIGILAGAIILVLVVLSFILG